MVERLNSIFCSVTFIGIIVLISCWLSLIETSSKPNKISPVIRGVPLNNPESGEICRSIDIRNRPQQFNRLRKCRIVEGFLIITLIEKYMSEYYDNLTFPLLTEITDYLLVYRVNGLTSIGRLFPNLSVIRGSVLFEGYALVIYENMQLDEIGLTSLTHINRGGVRIELNPRLCFVSSIDWNRIAVNSTAGSHFIQKNRPINECALCPGAGSTSLATQPLPICNVTREGDRLCWNQQTCQKICPNHCGTRSCNNHYECCDVSCLGGCSDDNPNLCTVCKYSTNGTFSDRKCASKCPANLFLYMDRLCLTATECKSIPRSINMDTSYPDYPFIAFKEECSITCPTGYEKVLNSTCQPCKGNCIKKCSGGSIDNIFAVRKLRGCTSIMGSLTINIRPGAHVVEELEASLSAIEEIEGFLKVTRTYSIVSFSFLRNLKYIHGETLDANKYALYVLDNQNLQNLWVENQTVAIERGKIFFHFNPKLCYYKIEALKPMIHDKDIFQNSDVALDSNGDRVACKITVLNATVIKVHSRAAVVEVGPMKFEDERVFLGYQYYIMEAPYTNVSMYQSRHGCENDAWNIDNDPSKDIFHLFSHLKPYTQYAFYVKTYTIASEQHGGQSDITYFRTLPDKPEPVRNLQYIANGNSEIVISWEPPKVANGVLKEYEIRGIIKYDDAKLTEQRNFCNEQIKDVKDGLPTITEQPRRTHIRIEESKLEKFQDALQNMIYVKREDETMEHFVGEAIQNKPDSTERLRKTRIKRSQLNLFPINLDDIEDEEILMKKYGNYKTISIKVNSSVTSLVINALNHYSTFAIGVSACRDGRGMNCSNDIIINSRTLKISDADNIHQLTAEVKQINNDVSIVQLVWKPPKSKRSLVVSYFIKYKKVDVENAKSTEICITEREYQNLNGIYTLKDLDSGYYRVQVRARSLADDGNFTDPVFFYIPKPELGLGWPITTAIVFSIVILIVIIGVLINYIRQKSRHLPSGFISVNSQYISPDEWEIPRNKIIQLRELGQGFFGTVYEGIVKNLSKELPGDTRCAIKTLKESATERDRIHLFKEAKIMKDFDTFHIVRLLGVVSRGQPSLVVMELMTNGDLNGYLRSHKPKNEPFKTENTPSHSITLKRILQMAIEIADGMAYLSDKKFVHRNLSTENCMVSEDLTVKIGDFGMTRDTYGTEYYRKATNVRWMAPESLKDGVFTSSSDVFSYGVVLWEMATFASQPYQNLSNDEVLRYVIDGGVMERPENCPDKLYNLMRSCWQYRVSSRPSFMDIIQDLLDDADSKFGKVSFYHSQDQAILKEIATIRFPDDVTTPLRMVDDEITS